MNHYHQLPIIRADSTVVVDLPCDTGEGPLWDDRTETLTWNDIPAGTLYRYDPQSGENQVEHQHNGAIGGHVLQDDGGLLLFCEDGQILNWANGRTESIIDSIAPLAGSRFNDVIADPTGSIYCGTMPLAGGSAKLYRLHTNGEIEEIWDDLGLGNGMGFSPDETTFYHSDSNKRVVYKAEFDRETGTIVNRSVLITLMDESAVPDGMTVDADGNIWLAVWNGSCLLKFNADGQPLGRLPLPVKKISSINFGGAGFTSAYVTTAGGTNRDGDDGPLAGSLFRIEIPGVCGKPDYTSRIIL